MSDDSKPRRWPWLRIFRIVLIAPFVLIVFGWLVLYGDSVYQRRKAEKLLKDLKSFPFATANFEQVREFVLAHGGRPEETELIYRAPLPPPPAPREYSAGDYPASYYGGTSSCTPQNCRFYIEIGNPPWLLHEWMRFFYLDLDSLGIRPWDFRIGLYVSNGRLTEASVGFVSAQAATWRSNRELLPTAYSARIATEWRWLDGTAPYDIAVRVKGGKRLESMVRPAAVAQINRALDIDMSCATRLSRGCRGFEEVVPAVWADYQILHKGWQPPGWSEIEFGPEGDLVWLFVGGTIFVASLAMLGAFLERLRPEKPANRRILQ